MFCKSTLPNRLPEVQISRSKCTPVAAHVPLPDSLPGFVPRLQPGTSSGRGSPAGFPTLKTLPVVPSLKAVGVSILGQGSKRESLVLTLSVSFSLDNFPSHTTQLRRSLQTETFQ